jgi:hypothetical protein
VKLIARRAEDDVVTTAIGLDEGQAERRPLEYDPFLAVADGGASEGWVAAALGSLGGFSLADGLLQATPTRSTRPRTSWAYGCCPRLHSDLAPLSA